ncbi:MAG: DUF1800 domain-containing protein [Verrucomicrobium sp.]|nr:DUF1800 domain-containing protein [Verrucomicrobium sp.]
MLDPFPPSAFTWEHAAHLLNRAGFGGTPEEVDSLRRMGLPDAVDFLVDYQKTPDDYAAPAWSVPDPAEVEQIRLLRGMRKGSQERIDLQRKIYKTYSQRMVQLHEWWLERMRTTGRPLQEKMTLFWHGLFATSHTKVRNPLLMWQQNEAFRQRAVGQWNDLLLAMAQSPAMLLWLDGNQSKKGAPNENFAREVMELFTLGEGHYTEQDIKESARAFTGWHTDAFTGKFYAIPAQFDKGRKTYLGQTGNFSGEEVIGILAREPRSSEYVWERLWRYFGSEEPNPGVSSALALQFQQSGLEFKPVLRTLFLSREFYAPGVVRAQVKGPVQWLVGSCRSLERTLPPTGPTYQMMKRLGQVVFAPPSVKGWDSGVSWISTNTLLDRYNFAAYLVHGRPLGSGAGGKQNPVEKAAAKMGMAEGGDHPQPVAFQGVDVRKLFSPDELANPDALLAALERRCIQAKLPDDRLASLKSFLSAQKSSNPETVRGAIRLLMSTPDYQLT